MKRCPSCSFGYEAMNWTCPVCRFAPLVLDGFPTIAPELAHPRRIELPVEGFVVAGARARGFHRAATRGSGLRYPVTSAMPSRITIIPVICIHESVSSSTSQPISAATAGQT